MLDQPNGGRANATNVNDPDAVERPAPGRGDGRLVDVRIATGYGTEMQAALTREAAHDG